MKRYASVCDGISACRVAWAPLGWQCRWVSEIDPFCNAVCEHHYPGQTNLGDMEKIGDAEPIELLVGGTPCQSFSVAGLRKGMADPRGNLALVFLRLAHRLRPRWVVWENVPGVLSSNKGRDFGAFLGAMGQLGYGWSYRVLDAQYVRVDGHERAVPQRRRRVFVVGHLGDWRRAAAVLLERSCLCGHPAPRREAGEGVVGSLASRSTAGGGLGTDFDLAGGVVSGTLDAHYGTKWGLEDQHVNAGCPNFVVSHPLRAEGSDASEDGTGRGTPIIPTIAFAQNQDGHVSESVCVNALTTQQTHASARACAKIRNQHGVRRLTPLECERLMGFPDFYTLVPYRGKPAADAPRYKALGNSMACNVMRWIGRRIDMVDSLVPPSPT